MLRSEIIGAVKRVVTALKVARIREVLRVDAEKNIQAILTSYSTLSSLLANPSEAEAHLIMCLKLTPLLHAEWWESIVSSKEDRPRTDRVRMFRNVDFVVEKLPQIVELLEQSEEVTAGTLSLLIPEAQGKASTPQRILAAIESISLLYRALCSLHNEAENTLALTRYDSGSDKSFDFTGLPQIIEQVKVVIFGIVDRVIYFRERQFSERVKCVAESLPILTQIADMEEQKKISAEQAELLRRDLIAGATKFLETGSSIPELSEGDRYNPGALLAPAPTLLLEGPKARRIDPPTASEPDDPTDGDSISSTQRGNPGDNRDYLEPANERGNNGETFARRKTTAKRLAKTS